MENGHAEAALMKPGTKRASNSLFGTPERAVLAAAAALGFA
jgi:hypothetical protein